MSKSLPTLFSSHPFPERQPILPVSSPFLFCADKCAFLLNTSSPSTFLLLLVFRTFSDACIIFNNILNCSLCLQPLFSLSTFSSIKILHITASAVLLLLKTSSFLSCSGQKVWCHLWLLFLAQSTYSLLANPIGSAFRVYPEFDCFSPYLIPNTVEEATVIAHQGYCSSLLSDVPAAVLTSSPAIRLSSLQHPE